ncbi:predicted protein [Naegleria gruberi]|uniref:Predicted protein n=1 Tax=Naegleria gruberi TaxID=5762 RepID=D2VD11_NAEGR|nr:uncharacterized protein NAEGRDRAFT_66758 [Naegleria gruberi]EFC45513.1 predicted protein [Naegleria gruberi]|eukprot:XP_002678257.1 predicted protein [Naegleria gruberi strain NEG-M]
MASTTTAAVNRITDFTPFFSVISKLRKPSPIRALMPIMNLPGMISLAGGLPNSQTFPFQSIKVDLNNQTSLEIGGKELSDGLQYHPSQGLPSLTQYMRKHQQVTHQLPSDENKQLWDVICTSGSQDGLTKAFEMFLNPYNVQLQALDLFNNNHNNNNNINSNNNNNEQKEEMDKIPCKRLAILLKQEHEQK